jgi:uncharacterized protein (DUF362 family)/NAD-dependent dihydropyrimidine dehydrogenase PreA subunit
VKRHKVIVKPGQNLGAAIAEVFRLLGVTDLGRKRVLVKPNMLRPALPDECVVTSPSIISQTVSYLTGIGAEVMVGDNPMPDRRFQHETEIAEYCGFVDASARRFRNIGRYSRRVKKPTNLLKEFYISRDIFDCDFLVSLPKYKTHELTTMTLSVKNHFGIIPGGFKPYIHTLFPGIEDFCEVLVEIYETRPPDVVIVDCLNIVDAKGKKYHPGIIVAGDNGHAVDYACALMAGINPRRVPTIRIAQDAGLFDPAMIEYTGVPPKISGYNLPFVFPLRNSVVEFVSRILYRILSGRVPVIDTAACARCLSCENVCPPGAIKKQKVDYKKCIECYCCLEVCPNHAVKIKFKLV